MGHSLVPSAGLRGISRRFSGRTDDGRPVEHPTASSPPPFSPSCSTSPTDNSCQCSGQADMRHITRDIRVTIRQGFVRLAPHVLCSVSISIKRTRRTPHAENDDACADADRVARRVDGLRKIPRGRQCFGASSDRGHVSSSPIGFQLRATEPRLSAILLLGRVLDGVSRPPDRSARSQRRRGESPPDLPNPADAIGGREAREDLGVRDYRTGCWPPTSSLRTARSRTSGRQHSPRT